MSDEQRGAMEPEAGTRRTFTEDAPAEDTEGHAITSKHLTGDDADTEGHAGRVRPAKDDERAGSETGTEASDDDTEGHSITRKF